MSGPVSCCDLVAGHSGRVLPSISPKVRGRRRIDGLGSTSPYGHARTATQHCCQTYGELGFW